MLNEVLDEEGELIDIENSTSWSMAALIARYPEVTFTIQRVSYEFVRSSEWAELGYDNDGRIISLMRLLAVEEEIALDERLPGKRS